MSVGSGELRGSRFRVVLPQGRRGDLADRDFETVAGVAHAAEEILKTASFTVGQGAEVDFPALSAAGIEYFVVYLDPPSDLSALERFASSVGVSKTRSGPTGV